MFTLKLLLKRSCWTFIFMALALPVSARVCFLPDSTDCGEGDVDVPEVQITCATYGGYEAEAACLEARADKTAQICTLNSGCYYPKCAYDSERKCKNDNPDKKCLSQDVDGVKCWYSQPKTCSEQGYKNTPCATDEDSGTVPSTLEASDGPCYKCTPKKECKYISNLYYGPKDTCPQYTDRKDAGVTGKDGVCSTCEPQACSAINTAYKNAANQNTCGSDKVATKVEGTDSAADGPCYTCKDKPIGCTYEYRQATTADSCGLTDLNTNYQCASTINGCNCYNQLQKVSSVWVYMTGQVFPYNRISNKSATCVDENNVTRYQTICQGTPKSKCNTSAGYEFKPNGCVSDTYTNGFEVKGDEWGDCVKKEEKCLYEYTRVTFSETHGDSTFSSSLYSFFQNHVQNTRGAGIYWNRSGSFDEDHDYSGFQMYSRIDKNSKSCQKINGVTAYETICPGTARVACKKKFVPNGCSSEQYAVYRLTVEGTDFGDCSCDTSKGLYDTDKSCTDATGLKCTGGKKGSCYQTCESAGMYSTEDACKKAASKYTECKFDAGSNCYAPYKMGWGIHYTHKVEKESNRTYNCIRETHGSNSTYTSSVSWSVYVMNGDNYNQAQALNGNKYQRIDDHEGEVRYPAGKYKICFDQSYAGSRGNISIYYMHLAKRSGDWCDYRWNDSDSQWHAAENNKEFCSDAIIFTSSTACIIATFEDNTEYYVEGSFKVREGERDGVYTYTCTQVEYAPY